MPSDSVPSSVIWPLGLGMYACWPVYGPSIPYPYDKNLFSALAIDGFVWTNPIDYNESRLLPSLFTPLLTD